jgi:hypothetical protein
MVSWKALARNRRARLIQDIFGLPRHTSRRAASFFSYTSQLLQGRCCELETSFRFSELPSQNNTGNNNRTSAQLGMDLRSQEPQRLELSFTDMTQDTKPTKEIGMARHELHSPY